MRCPRCGGVVYRDGDGPACFNCGPLTLGPRPVSVSRVDDERCEGCNTLLGPRPKPRKERRRYCNDLCRTRTWKRKHKAVA